MKIAVYGTLLTGERNYHIGAGALSRIPCTIYGTLYDTGRGYPAFVPCGNTSVKAELLDVDEVVLAQLDKLEEYPQLYDRVTVTATLMNGTRDDAMVYVMKKLPADAVKITEGDWRKWRTGK